MLDYRTSDSQSHPAGAVCDGDQIDQLPTSEHTLQLEPPPFDSSSGDDLEMVKIIETLLVFHW